MNLTLFIYLADRVESISSTLFLTSILGMPLLTGILMLIENGAKSYNEPTTVPKPVKVIPFVTFFMLALSMLIPSKEGIYLMGAAGGVQAVAENPRGQELASNSLKLLENKIKEQLQENIPKKEESK